jgi:hypothetical protein
MSSVLSLDRVCSVQPHQTVLWPAVFLLYIIHMIRPSPPYNLLLQPLFRTAPRPPPPPPPSPSLLQ